LILEPADEVVLTFTLSDGSAAELSHASLTFTPDNWNEPQTLTLSDLGVLVSDPEGAPAYTLTIDSSTSADSVSQIRSGSRTEGFRFPNSQSSNAIPFTIAGAIPPPQNFAVEIIEVSPQAPQNFAVELIEAVQGPEAPE
jgi:hypothetical protein